MHHQSDISDRSYDDRGQAAIALVGVLVLASVLVVALAWVGEAVAHRANARTAADAVALAAASDSLEADMLAGWYRSRGVTIEQRGDQTRAASGPSQAAARARVTESGVATEPVFRAIVARAEQLLARSLSSVRWQPSAFQLTGDDASAFLPLAAEFSLCVDGRVDSPADTTTFTWC